MFTNTFIDQSYAAIPKCGTHKAKDDVHKYLKLNSNEKYYLKIDVKKFFPNIDKEILKSLLRRKIKDKDLLSLLDEIIDGYPKSGIPIGNYTSQYLGNFFLTYFDHWIKEEKKIRGYFRYMDDMIFIGESKEELWSLLDEIRIYLHNNLKLTVKENYQVYRISDSGVNFVGYRIYPNKIIVRNDTKRRMIRKSHKLMKKESLTDSDKGSIASYNGVVKHVTGKKLKQDILEPLQRKVKACP